MSEVQIPDTSPARPGLLRQIWQSDLAHSFRQSKVTVVAGIISFGFVFIALFAPWIAPSNPYDMTGISVLNAFLPPVWMEGGDSRFLLGTDSVGRDILSTIMYGSRISLGVGVAAVFFAATLGISLGLISGYIGGRTDAAIMRVAEIQLSFPDILIALLIDGIIRSILGPGTHGNIAFIVVISAISLAYWVQFARTVRSTTMVEKGKEYVQAARVAGKSPGYIMFKHLLPNVMGPVLVIATINLALAIVTEATLSFLGVGLPPTQPSLGTLIRVGNDFLFSGEWWITIFPGITLAIMGLSVNLLGDWLRDALNPKLR
ncbi:MAG: ABC transporter permease [Alphaproteobacteria bacterium]|nr:ABC transporter permease [Alphaproteobacteria bacterium]